MCYDAIFFSGSGAGLADWPVLLPFTSLHGPGHSVSPGGRTFALSIFFFINHESISGNCYKTYSASIFCKTVISDAMFEAKMAGEGQNVNGYT